MCILVVEKNVVQVSTFKKPVLNVVDLFYTKESEGNSNQSKIQFVLRLLLLFTGGCLKRSMYLKQQS